MPVVSLSRADLEDMVGVNVDTIVEVLPRLGADVECVGEEIQVEFFPNRPDLFSVEGTARAIKGMLGIEKGLPAYVTSPSRIEIRVDPSVNAVRPYVVCAVVRGITINERIIKSLVDLQEDLHWGIGRDRRKASIGIHDLSKVCPPFTYSINEVAFVPLDFSEPMTPAEILRAHPKGKQYAHVVGDHHPLILDANQEVLSFPPIINGELTRVIENTTDLFIEVTGIELKAIQDCLHILVAAMHDRGASIETVDIVYRDDHVLHTPDVTASTFVVKNSDVIQRIGANIEQDELTTSLQRMRMDADIRAGEVKVSVPCYRTDIMHPVDIIEDVAIGFGYENLPFSSPKLGTIGSRLKEEQRSTVVRAVLQGLGFLEVVTLMLASDPEQAVIIENPILEEHISLRTSLLPGLIDTLALNQHREYPQMVYEVGDVVRLVADVAEERRLCAGVIASSSTNFTEIKQVVNAVLRELDRPFEVTESDDSLFIEGRRATIVVDGQVVGTFGEINPDILVEHKLIYPVSAFEFHLSGR
ncbi:MAG TPA: phenylalanine--tRNA ligase subunit beta [Candidatus Bathyarchaeia archaeon]|nr:phenylalanine--tRNA ligase subunit beta [Candidatus Bathyarchaeia archaeon]